MRVLHTADWHLGQVFHNLSRDAEHRAFLAWLLDTIEENEVDALLIAGDIFDAATPPLAALRMWYDFVADAHTRRPTLDIVAIAGNHDSPARLEVAESLQRRFRVHAVGRLPRIAETGAPDIERIVVPLRDVDGKIRAWCGAVPYLRPGDLDVSTDEPNWAQVGIRRIYDAAVAHTNDRRESSHAFIATGHLHLTGARISRSSEREIPIGAGAAIDTSIFPDAVNYVALGHLHLAQWLDPDGERIRYCGSPLPLSMAEADYPRHSVTLVEFSGDQIADTMMLTTPRTVELLRVPEIGAAELDAVMEKLGDLPAKSRLPRERWPYLSVHIQLHHTVPDLRAKLEAQIGRKPVRLVAIHTETDKLEAPPHVLSENLRDMRPEDVFRRLYAERYASANAVPDSLMQQFLTIIDEVSQS